MAISAGALEVIMFSGIARLQADMAAHQRTVSGAMKNIESAVSSAKSVLASLGIGLGVGYFVSLIKGSIDAADHLNDLSKTLDISVEKLSGIKLLARQAGGDLDGLSASIAKLSQNIGKDPQKFAALGITAKDNVKAFQQLSDVFVALQDPQQRAAVMAAALGKSWASAAPALSEGSKRIGEIIETGARLSGMTKEMAVNADDFNDKMAELSTTLGATKTKLVADMLPGMRDIADAMREAAKEGGLLLTVWVGLGGAMDALINSALRLTGLDATTRRLKDINKQVELLTKQIDSGSSNPNRALGGIAGFLMPDVKVSAAQLAVAINARRELLRAKSEIEAFGQPKPAETKPVVDPAIAAAAAAKAAAFLAGEKEAKLAAAELLKYENALRSLEDQLGKYNNQTVEQKMVNDLARGSLKGLTDEHQRNLIAVAKQVDLKNVQKVALDAYVKTMEMDLALEQEVADLMAARATKEGEAIKAQHQYLDGLRFEAALVGKSNVDREIAIALRALETGGIDKQSAEYARLTVTIKEEIQAKSAAETLNNKTIEQIRFETMLIGLNTTEREQAIAVRQLELTGIDQNTEAYKNYVAALKGAIAEKDFAEANKAVLVGMWQDVDRVAHDTFVSIFDSGKNTFERLRDSLKNTLYALLYKMAVQPFLIQVVTSTAGPAVAQQVFGTAANQSGGGGLMNLASTGNSLYNALSGNSSSMLSNIGSALGIGGSASTAIGFGGAAGAGVGLTSAGVATNAAIASGSLFGTLGPAALGTAEAVGAGIGASLVAEGAIVGGAGIAGAAGGAAMGAGAMAMTAIPYIGAAIAIAYALGVFGKGKTPAVGTGYLATGETTGGNVDSSFFGGITNKARGEALADQAKNMADLVSTLKPAVEELSKIAKTFGVSSESFGAMRTSFSGEVAGIGQENVNKLNQVVTLDVVNKLAEQIVPTIKDFQKETEQLVETLARLGAESNLVEKIFEIMGKPEGPFAGTGDAALKLKDDLITLMGGLQNATALAESYYANFHSDAERFAIDLGRVNDAMTELGISALPRTRAEFRMLVEAQDLTSRSGQEMFAALMTLAPAFAAVTATMEEAALAADTLAGRIAITQYAALQAVNDQISASRASASAARQAASSYSQITDTLLAAVARLRGGGAGSGASLNTAFGTAMTGDATALSSLPGIADDFLAAKLATSRTAVDFAREQARVAGMLEQAAVISEAMVDWNEYQATLLETQTGVLEAIKSQLESPSPDAGLFQQQVDLLSTIGTLLQEQTLQIVSGSGLQAVLMHDQTGKIVLANALTTDQTGAITLGNSWLAETTALQGGIQSMLDQQTLEIAAGNISVRDQTGQIIAGNTLVKDQSGQITIGNSLTGVQTSQIITGNAVQDTIKNLSARDTSLSEAMLSALVTSSVLETNQFAGMLAGIVSTVTLLQQLVDLSGQKSAADLAIAQAKAIADAKAAAEAAAKAKGTVEASSAYEGQKAVSDALKTRQDLAFEAMGPQGDTYTAEDITKGAAGGYNAYYTYTPGNEAAAVAAREASAAYNTAFFKAYDLWKAIPGHASGGIASGWSMVGERGPELANFTSPARIYTAGQTRGMLGGDNSELLSEIRALRAEVAALRAPAEQTARATRGTNDTLTRVTQDGVSVLTTAA